MNLCAFVTRAINYKQPNYRYRVIKLSLNLLRLIEVVCKMKSPVDMPPIILGRSIQKKKTCNNSKMSYFTIYFGILESNRNIKLLETEKEIQI